MNRFERESEALALREQDIATKAMPGTQEFRSRTEKTIALRPDEIPVLVTENFNGDFCIYCRKTEKFSGMSISPIPLWRIKKLGKHIPILFDNGSKAYFLMPFWTDIYDESMSYHDEPRLTTADVPEWADKNGIPRGWVDEL
jgi:hypothetical protein